MFAYGCAKEKDDRSLNSNITNIWALGGIDKNIYTESRGKIRETLELKGDKKQENAKESRRVALLYVKV